MKLLKILNVIERSIIKKEIFLSVDRYINDYTKYLKKIGVQFTGKEKKVKFIEPSVYFDGWDYSKIKIGDNITISKDVILLTHDYSINAAMCSIGKKIDRHQGELRFLKEISIGDNCFVGARAILLPGTEIGKNCIIGAGAVVKGKIPENSVIAGNPSKIICKTTEFVKKHLECSDFEIE